MNITANDLESLLELQDQQRSQYVGDSSESKQDATKDIQDGKLAQRRREVHIYTMCTGPVEIPSRAVSTVFQTSDLDILSLSLSPT